MNMDRRIHQSPTVKICYFWIRGTPKLVNPEKSAFRKFLPKEIYFSQPNIDNRKLKRQNKKLIQIYTLQYNKCKPAYLRIYSL